jgi:hypothetical protein
MKKGVRRETAVERLERQYAELVQQMRDLQSMLPSPKYRENLEQPSTLRTVETTTTYGAFELPA